MRPGALVCPCPLRYVKLLSWRNWLLTRCLRRIDKALDSRAVFDTKVLMGRRARLNSPKVHILMFLPGNFWLLLYVPVIIN